jgi:hypothetical protein
VCQYLYFCTSKASKLSSWGGIFAGVRGVPALAFASAVTLGCRAGILTLLALLVQKHEFLAYLPSLLPPLLHSVAAQVYSVYLLYWYKNTNIDATAAA